MGIFNRKKPQTPETQPGADDKMTAQELHRLYTEIQRIKQQRILGAQSYLRSRNGGVGSPHII